MAGSYQVTIVSPRGKVFEGAVTYLVAPCSEGEIGVLVHHAPMIAALRRGLARLVTEAQETLHFVLGAGTVEICKNEVVLLVDTAEKAEDEAEAKALLQKQLAQLGKAAAAH